MLSRKMELGGMLSSNARPIGLHQSWLSTKVRNQICTHGDCCIFWKQHRCWRPLPVLVRSAMHLPTAGTELRSSTFCVKPDAHTSNVEIRQGGIMPLTRRWVLLVSKNVNCKNGLGSSHQKTACNLELQVVFTIPKDKICVNFTPLDF